MLGLSQHSNIRRQDDKDVSWSYVLLRLLDHRDSSPIYIKVQEEPKRRLYVLISTYLCNFVSANKNLHPIYNYNLYNKIAISLNKMAHQLLIIQSSIRLHFHRNSARCRQKRCYRPARLRVRGSFRGSVWQTPFVPSRQR